MKTLLTVLLSLALGASLLQAAAFEKDAKFRTTKIHISSDKPVGTGSNIFVLDIKKDGKAPIGAKVNVKAFMPAMPGMPAMESKTDAKDLGNGKYEIKLNIAMGGTWQVHIFITPTQGKRSRVKTSINF
ncbi:FixH family protein [Sulfurimonas sp. MAG313]|nr:FixH family protein [Sulfurimonas sp. MAG313]MDF1880192.1 FixH family protein [Sulfurimonas sp. MAG313]